MKQKLPERDQQILVDLLEYNGLPTQSILERYFKGKTKYGYKRLGILQQKGYIDSKYYYVKQRGKLRRISAILYIAYQGLRYLDITKTVNTYNVKPKDDRLDIHYLLGSLYTSVPELISGKAARDKYGLKNFMPISSCYPGKRPVYVFILGKNPVHNEAGRIRAFIKSMIRPGDHLVISRKYYKSFDSIPIRFVPWPLAPEVVPIGLKNKEHYLEEFKNILRSRFSTS